MRSYGKRIIKRGAESAVSQKVETRYGVIWDINLSLRVAYVKIQGSNKQIKAYFSQNWTQVPSWLKEGMAVKLQHTGGIRGRIEIVGEGNLIPSAVSGSDTPTLPADEDDIITGLEVIEIPYGTWMKAMVKVGTVRLAGITTTVDAITMSNSAIFAMGMGGFMGEIAGIVSIDAAPSSGNFRYDMVVIGDDLAFDYVKGTASGDPVMPAIPADHLKCGHILLYAGMTDITQGDIDKTYSAPYVSSLVTTIADSDLAWAELSTTVTVAVEDQYGNAILSSGLGWELTLAITSGNGTISEPGGTSSLTSVSAFTGAASNQIIFTYTRDQLDPGDVSPALQISISGYPGITSYGYIILRDASGDIMT
jgi:hypothetical protein